MLGAAAAVHNSCLKRQHGKVLRASNPDSSNHAQHTEKKWQKAVPDPDLEMGGGGGGVRSPKKFLGLKIRGGPPLDLPLEGNGQKLSELDEIL